MFFTIVLYKWTFMRFIIASLLFFTLVSTNDVVAKSDEFSNHPVIKKRVDPSYPLELAKQGNVGWVDLVYTLNEKARPENIVVIGGNGKKSLEKAAIRALEKWRYKKIDDFSKINFGKLNVRLEFSLEGMNNEVSEDYLALAKTAEQALQAQNYETLVDTIEKMKPDLYASIRQQMIYWSLLEAKHQIYEDFYQQSYALTKLKDLMTYFELTPDKKHAAQIQIFIASTKAGLYHSAAEMFKKMQAEENIYLKDYENTYQQVKDFISTAKELDNTYNLVEGVAYFDLYMPIISLIERKGQINKVNLRCEHHHTELPKDLKKITLEKNWGECALLLQGEPQSTLRVVQSI